MKIKDNAKNYIISNLKYKIYNNQKVVDWDAMCGEIIEIFYKGVVYNIEVIEYYKENQVLKVKYNNEIKNIRTNSILNCNIGRIVNLITHTHRFKVGEIIENKLEVLKCFHVGTVKKYEVKCLQCGCKTVKTQSNIDKGQMCPVCSGRKVIKGINDIGTTHPDVVKYFLYKDDVYSNSYGSEKKVKVICPECGNEKLMAINKLTSRGICCDICGDGISYPEKIMINILKQLNVEFKKEYSPKWCRYEINKKIAKGRYDFYIPSNNIIIEMDGAQHNYKEYMGYSVEIQRKIDFQKDTLAHANGIKIIRIDCGVAELENIKENILNSDLKLIFNLRDIDWERCQKNALPNKVREACDLWNSGIISTSEIGKRLNLKSSAIYKYLKRGSNLGWCKYDPHIGKAEALKELQKNKRKRVYCYELGKVFDASQECADYLKNILNDESIRYGNICAVCNGKRETYKGLHFKYL